MVEWYRPKDVDSLRDRLSNMLLYRERKLLKSLRDLLKRRMSDLSRLSYARIEENIDARRKYGSNQLPITPQ